MSNADREQALRKLPKDILALLHKGNGGLMPLSIYRRWTKDELVRAVLEDETHTEATS